jgi:hypothetical protein
MVTIDRWFFSVRYPKASSAGVRAGETRGFFRAPNLITICEAIPPPSINKVAQNSPNPDRLSSALTLGVRIATPVKITHPTRRKALATRYLQPNPRLGRSVVITHPTRRNSMLG